MSYQFVMGSAGCGKSHWLYSKITKEAAKNLDQRYLVLVPEQFTMQTQRELVLMSKSGGILNIDVLSFERLAFHLMDELAEQKRLILGDTGKNLLLRRLSGELKGELSVLSGNLSRQGYIAELKSLISEFAQYGIGIEHLEQLSDSEKSSLPDGLCRKLSDIRLVYQRFREFLVDRTQKKEEYLTAEETLGVLKELIPHSKRIRGAIFVLDGYTGFTPVQENVVEELLRYAKKVYLSVTIDIHENIYGSRGEYDLFELSRQTIRSVQDMAQFAGVPEEEAVLLEARKKPSRELTFLEERLFRYGNHRRENQKKEERPEKQESSGCRDLRILRMKNPVMELEKTAEEIRCRNTRFPCFWITNGGYCIIRR